MDDLFQTLVAAGHGKHTNSGPDAVADTHMGAAFGATFEAVSGAEADWSSQATPSTVSTPAQGPKPSVDANLPHTLPTNLADAGTEIQTSPHSPDEPLELEDGFFPANPPSISNIAVAAQLAGKGPLTLGERRGPLLQDGPHTQPINTPNMPTAQDPWMLPEVGDV